MRRSEDRRKGEEKSGGGQGETRSEGGEKRSLGEDD